MNVNEGRIAYLKERIKTEKKNVLNAELNVTDYTRRLSYLEQELKQQQEKPSKFGINSDYETGTILCWEVANRHHLITAVKHSTGYWFTSYKGPRGADRFVFAELIEEIADRPCFIVTEMQELS